MYRKIHLFDVKVSDREYLESANIAGNEIVTAKAGAATLGLSVCYVVRLLYRLLALRGAEILAVPAALHPADRQGPLGAATSRAGRREPGFRRSAGPVGAEGRRALDVRAEHDR